VIGARRDGPRLDAALAGKDYGERVHEVRGEAIAAYARATNDANEHYLAGAAAVAGPVWPVVPAFPSFMAVAQDPELGVDLRRLLHASEEHVLRRPLRPGDVVTVHTVLESVADHPAGQTFTIAAFERGPSGDMVAEVRGTMLIRGAGRGGAGQPPAAPLQPAPGAVVFEEATTVDADQMERYAAASGDRNPIHLDTAAARRAGLRRPILHGMCTMAMATKAAVNGLAGGDPSRIARVAMSFTRPVVAGQTVTTRVRQLGERDDVVAFTLETIDDAGAPVIADAEVDVRRS
jgi:acyl dehydratase